MLLDNQKHKTSIAVIIPAYNVEKYIGKVIKGLPDFIDFITIVDDCSKDQTIQEINNIKDKRIHLIKHSKNQGVGGAMLSGYQIAYDLGADIMIKIDGDDQMDPNYIMPLLEPILNLQADYTKGNRFLHMKELQKMPGIRRIGNWGLSFFTKLASGYWNIFDPTNGYTALHREAYRLLNKESIDKDFFFETSMLIQLQRIQAAVRDVSIPAKYDDQSSNLSPLKTLGIFPLKLIRGLNQRIVFQYFLVDFSVISIYLVVGIPSLAFGFIWGLLKWIQSIRTGIITTTGTVLIAVLPIIIGVQLITQALSLDINNVPTSSIRKG